MQRLASLLIPLFGGFALAQTTLTINVTSAADTGPGSFRAAVDAANQVAHKGHAKVAILFHKDLRGKNITLTGGLPILRPDKCDLSVDGTGARVRILSPSQSSVAGVLTVVGDDCALRDLAFINTNTKLTSGDNLILMGADRALLDNCEFVGPPDFGLNCIGCLDLRLKNCVFKDGVNGGGGVLAHEGSDRITIEGCSFLALSKASGISLVAVTAATIRGCTFDAAGAGLDVGVALEEVCRNVTIEDCTFNNLAGTGIAAPITLGLTVQKGSGSGCQFLGIAGPAITLYDKSRNIVIRDATFNGNGGTAASAQVQVNDCSDMELDGCDFRNGKGAALALDGSARIKVGSTRRNTMTSNTKGAVLIKNKCEDIVLHNNEVNGNGALTQITIDDSTKVALTANDIKGGGLAAISLTAATDVTIGRAGAGNTITSHSYGAIACNGSSKLIVIEANTLSANVAAAQLSALLCSDLRILTNKISGGTSAMVLERCDDIVIAKGNTFEGNSTTGVEIRNCTNVKFGDATDKFPSNTIKNNGTAVALVADSRDPKLLELRNNDIQSNKTSLLVSGASVSGCLIDSNTVVVAATASAGLQVDSGASSVKVSNNVFSGYSQHGLRILNSNKAEVRDNKFLGRTGGTTGVGIQVIAAHDVQLHNNEFTKHNNGGLVCGDSDRLLVGPGNRFHANGGHGMLLQGGQAKRQITVQSTAVLSAANNSNYGVVVDNMDATINHLTLTSFNVGVEVLNKSTLNIANSIVWGSSWADRRQASGTTATMNYCIYTDRSKPSSQNREGTWGGGSGNQTSATANFPGFVDLANGDIHLKSGSPAIDKASATILNVPPTDVDGQKRISNSIPDIGADEFGSQTAVAQPFDLASGWLRQRDANRLDFALDAPSQAGKRYLLLGSLSGTAPGVPIAAGRVALNFDPLSAVFLANPEHTGGSLDSQGRAAHRLEIPPGLIPLLPGDLTFVFVTTDLRYFSNPVVVRFLR